MSGRLLGYPQVTEVLKRGLAQGRLSHAYLVAGPPQVGKMTLAIDLTQALNCQGEVPPCGQCPSCQKTLAGIHPDLQIMGLLSEGRPEGRARKEIGIDQVRALQHDASLHPFWGRYKVFIVDGAERLSSEAANCFLKTLEEPPPQAVIILLTSQGRALPPTVVSRCQRIELRPLPLAFVQEVLREKGATVEEARLLARLSQGCLGWALSALRDPSLMAQRARGLGDLEGLLTAGLRERFRLAEEMAGLYHKDREGLGGTLQMWLGWWRDLLLMKEGCHHLVTNLDQEEILRHWATRYSAIQIVSFMQAVATTSRYLERNVNPRLALEALMLQLPTGQAASRSQEQLVTGPGRVAGTGG